MAACMTSWLRNRTKKEASATATSMEPTMNLQATRRSSYESATLSNLDALLDMNYLQQQRIEDLSQQLQRQSDIASQLNSALQAESFKGTIVQESLAALQGKLKISSSAQQLATDQVDRLDAQLEEMQALATEQANIGQAQADHITSLTERVEGLQHRVKFLENRLALETTNNKCLSSQVQENGAKLAAAELSRNRMSHQLSQLRSTPQASQASPLSFAVNNPWRDLVMVLPMLVVNVLPVNVVLMLLLLSCGVFVSGVLVLAHTAELMQAVVTCCTHITAAVESGVCLLTKLRTWAQQLAAMGFAGHAGSFHDRKSRDISSELLSGFNRLGSSGRASLCSSRMSLAASSRSSLSMDIADGTDTDVCSDGDVLCIIGMKKDVMVNKEYDL